ncbi:MAG: phage holin family protein [Bacteroidia bacterium]|nr:phage holin family protein [Bacteroidia bacterium]NNC84832.1 phage holin family protein [Bacteroidia bacterium]NNM16497.1 phage holin family protein [Bacteroidia bacterium]
MNLILKLVISSLAVYATAYLLPEVYVDSFVSAIIVAVVLGLLNTFLKPLLVILTIPATIFTLGLFLLVINALIIMLADHLLDGFTVTNFWWALLFSIVLSVITSILNSLSGANKKRNN